VPSIVIFICPIAIAVEQIINSVCFCHTVRPSVCLHVCTLTVAFFDRFSPKVAQRQQPSEVRSSSLGSTSHHPFLYVNPLKTRHFRPKGPENPRKRKYTNFCLKCSRIAGIPATREQIGVEEYDGKVIFQTGSRTKTVSCMRIEKSAI